MPQLAVITADLKESTTLDAKELERVMNCLREELDVLRQSDEVRYYEIYRGDAAQLTVPEPYRALQIAYWLKTCVNRLNPKGKEVRRGMKVQYDLRLAIGVGEAERGSADRLTNEIAFVRAGRELDRVREAVVTLGAVTGRREVDRELETELFLCEGITRGWTVATAEVVYHKMQGKTEREIGKELGISQSAVNQHSRAAYWNGLQMLLKRYRELTGEGRDE